MKRKFKAVIAALLAAAMCASFAGCKSDPEKDLERDFEKAANELDKEYGNTGNGGGTSAVSKPDPKPLDPFENVELVYEGISPLVNAKIKGSNSMVSYTLDRDRDLKNGDKVTVYAKLSSSKAEDFVLTSDSKEFTVSNRPSYIMELSDLTDADIQKLGKNVEEFAENAVKNHFCGGEGSTMNSFEFLGNILYTNDRNKYLCFVYKANTTFAKAGQTLDYYFVGRYEYIYRETDGTLVYYDNEVKYFDLGDMSILIDGRYFGGYATLDSVYSELSRVAGSGCERESNVKE